jgi:hypothetical protein
MKGSIVSDDDNAAAVTSAKDSEDQGTIAPELFDTSSLTRRLARGEYTQSIARKITEQEEVGARLLPSTTTTASSSAVTSSMTSEDESFEPCPRGSDVSLSVRTGMFRAIGEEEECGINHHSTLSSELSNIPPPSLQQTKSSGRNNNSNNKSALDSFSEYISFFFKNAENYEEMLEKRSHSQRHLKASMDRKRQNSSRFASPEEGDDDDDDDVDMEEIIIQQGGSIEHTGLTQRASTPSTPNLKLSDSQEAMAAVEAISNFRSLREVKKEIMDRGSTLDEQQGRPKKQPKISHSIGQGAPPCDTDVDDIRQTWDSFCNEKKKNKYNEIGFESIRIPVSVDDFYKHVLKDNADHSIGKFMRDIGELEVESTSWQPSTPTSTTHPQNRTIQYIHPINAPMAPPTAAARKEQSVHKFGNVGLCLETCTFVENVPMADCFVVRDRLWVNENPGEESGCIVSVTFQIDFIKGTMFRRIIENTTRGEYQRFWTKFCDMIKSNLGSSSELDEVVIELEEAAALLEGEGQEVPLSSVLGRIRSSSRRLSVVARRTSVRHVNGTSENMESSILFVVLGKGKVVVLELFTIVKQHVKQHFAEKDDSYVLGCFVILMLVIFNIMTLRQIRLMSRSIDLLTNQINEAMLTKMGSGENCVMN